MRAFEALSELTNLKPAGWALVIVQVVAVVVVVLDVLVWRP